MGRGGAALGQGGRELDGAGAGGEAGEEAAVAGGRAHDEVLGGLLGGELVQGDHFQVEREPGGGGGGVEDPEEAGLTWAVARRPPGCLSGGGLWGPGGTDRSPLSLQTQVRDDGGGAECYPRGCSPRP